MSVKKACSAIHLLRKGPSGTGFLRYTRVEGPAAGTPHEVWRLAPTGSSTNRLDYKQPNATALHDNTLTYKSATANWKQRSKKPPNAPTPSTRNLPNHAWNNKCPEPQLCIDKETQLPKKSAEPKRSMLQ